MVSYAPPTFNLPIFEPSVFGLPVTEGGGGGLTLAEAQALFVSYPTAQGTVTFPNIKTTSTTIALGNGAAATAQGTDGVAIGNGAGANQGNNCVALGAQAGLVQTGAAIAIGHNAGANQGTSSISIGHNSAGSGTNNIAIGDGATTSTFNSSVAIGINATATANNQINLGTTTETVIVKGTATSTTTTSGALQVKGGAGIVENLNVGGTTTSTGAITANGGLTIGGSNNITLGSGTVAPTATQLGYSNIYTISVITLVAGAGYVYPASFTIVNTGTYLITYKVGINGPDNQTSISAFCETFISTTNSTSGNLGYISFDVPVTSGGTKYLTATTTYCYTVTTANKTFYVGYNYNASVNTSTNYTNRVLYVRIA